MKILFDSKELKKKLKNVHNIGFVPTMGSIHRGHESLIHKSKKVDLAFDRRTAETLDVCLLTIFQCVIVHGIQFFNSHTSRQWEILYLTWAISSDIFRRDVKPFRYQVMPYEFDIFSAYVSIDIQYPATTK